MADVNWEKYNCDLCRTVCYVAAAAASGVLVWILAKAGLPIVLLGVLFLLVWFVLISVIDGYCKARGRTYTGAGHGVPSPDAAASSDAKTSAASASMAETDAPVEPAGEPSAAHAAAQAAQEQAAREAEAAERAAEAQAAAEAAQAEQAAAEAAAKMARDAAAEAERTAAAEEAERAAQAKAEEDAAASAAAKTAQEAAAKAAAKAAAASLADANDGAGEEAPQEGTRPQRLDGPRGGQADDLKRIRGIGGKLEALCHDLGFYHFDQVANWTADEVAWVDANLTGFKGRVTRDAWVQQAGVLASGAETDFSRRVDEGDVPSSQ